ncbi:MAG: NAD-dependent epimerase/dehydratase family protein [Myxococcota bacterium]
MTEPVCITGATGFVGSHIVDAFLAAGIPVRAAVRSPDDPEKTGPLKVMAEHHGTALSFHAADLATPGSFDEALSGSAGLIHVAAVARLAAPDPQRQIVDPSIDGARNVLTAATEAGIQRVVLTSSIAAVGDYRSAQGRALNEADWNDAATLKTNPYGYAKTQAERLAWELSEAAPWSLAVINPGMVMGPVFNKRHCRASPITVRDILKVAAPANPRICLPIVDARDVAAAHLIAYQRQDVSGRHVLVNGNRWLKDMAVSLDKAFPERNIRTGELPSFMVKLVALFSKALDGKVLADILDREPHYDGSHATTALGITYRDLEQSIMDTAQSMVSQGFV